MAARLQQILHDGRSHLQASILGIVKIPKTCQGKYFGIAATQLNCTKPPQIIVPKKRYVIMELQVRSNKESK